MKQNPFMIKYLLHFSINLQKVLFKFSNSNDSVVYFSDECLLWSFFNLVLQIQLDHKSNVFDILGKES